MDDIQSWWEVPSIAHFCSLFRAAFNLLDFDIEELEEALLTDGAEDSGSSLLQELIVRLLCGCLGNNDISTFNYQMFLRRLFRQKCQEYGRDNPFNTDMDFQFLPLRTKVEILHALCDFRLDADDVQDLLKNLESDSLRVEPLGHDENNSAYWYFYGTRLYREDYPKAGHQRTSFNFLKRKTKEKRRKGKEERRRKKHNKSENEEIEEKGSTVWQVVCFTEQDWDRITDGFKDSRSKAERELYHTLSEDFLPEIPRLFAEKERLQRKRMLEYQPRRQSSRLEKLKQQKEEEEKSHQKEEKEQKARQRQEQEKKEKMRQSRNTKDRANRALMRSVSRTNSDCDSTGSVPAETPAENKSSTMFVGRQTNNSLSSATGQIVIQGLRRKLRSSQVFRQTEEDLQTGMYKILEFIKNHEDAWPFLEPVDEEYAPRYYSIITKPMDLQRMEDKLDEGEYMSFADFKSDFQLIVDNCRKYNGMDNEYTEMVGNLQEAFRLAIDRYLESEPSSDEEVAVEFPEKTSEKPTAVRHTRKRREAVPVQVPEEPPRTPSLPPTPPSPPASEKVEKESEENPEPVVEAPDTEEGSTKDETESRRFHSHNNTKRKKKSGAIKNAADIEALELATEQTLKDINKWLDDTPRYSEFSSASNSPSHLVSAEEYEIMGSRNDNEYRRTFKVDKPSRLKDSKENSKRRLHKDPSKQLRRREVQRTIERLQPGKSKGNLLSNIQSAAKVLEEGPPGKPKDARSALFPSTGEVTPQLSLGTVLGTDVLGFGVGENNHNFEKKEEDASVMVSDEPPKPPLDIRPKTPQLQAESLRIEENIEKKEKEEVVAKPPSRESKQEKVMPNLSAWFKAFGAPKASILPKKRAESLQEGGSADVMVVEERRDICNIYSLENAPAKNNLFEERPAVGLQNHVSVVVEVKSCNEVDQHKACDEIASPLQHSSTQQVVPRQRKVSTGSSVSERSSFSQDLMDPVDGSSPRLSLDERPYPSPLHRSPMAASPIMASPRPEESPKFASYPPMNGTIRVGFYQDTSSSSLQKSSPEKNSCSPKEQMQASPFPTYSPRMYPPHDPGGFLSYQSQPPGPETSSQTLCPPYSINPLVQYYDTSKPLTDQYRAARTQPSQVFSPDSVITTGSSLSTSVSSNSSHPLEIEVIATRTIQKNSSSVFPVKKRLYSEMEAGSIPPVSRVYQLSPPPAHSQGASRIRISHSPDIPHVLEKAHHNPPFDVTFQCAERITSSPTALLSISTSERIYNTRRSSPDIGAVLDKQENPTPAEPQMLKKGTIVKKAEHVSSMQQLLKKSILVKKSDIDREDSVLPTQQILKKGVVVKALRRESDTTERLHQSSPGEQNHYHSLHDSSLQIRVSGPPAALHPYRTKGKRNTLGTSESIPLSENEHPASKRLEENHSPAHVIRQSVRQEITSLLEVEAAQRSCLSSGDKAQSPQQSESTQVERLHQTNVTTTSSAVISERLPSAAAPLHGSDMSYHRGPFSPVPPTSIAMEPLALRGNISNLTHVVDRFPPNERLLPTLSPAASPFYGEKSLSSQHMFRQGVSSTLQTSTISTTAMALLSQPSSAIMTMAYSHDSQIAPTTIAYNRSVPELATVLSSKVANIPTTYKRSVQDLSAILPATSASPVNTPSFNRSVSELSTILPSKVSSSLNAQAAYNRSVGELSSVLPAKVSPPVDLQTYSHAGHAVTDLSTVLPNKVPVPPTISVPSSYSRQATDYSLLTTKTTEAPPAPKSSRKRKSKQSATVNSEVSVVTSAPSSTAFQQYVGLKTPSVSEPSAISLKTTSVVPGSAFNFGPAHSGLGLYTDKDGYAGFLEEFRTAPSSYYMPTANPAREKLNQSSHPSAPAPSSAFPFLGHPRTPTYPLAQAFMNQSGLVDPAAAAPPLYQQYLQRHQEELLRHSGGTMVLHQGLLGTPAGYPAGYHPALGIRQPYDTLNRHSWL